MRTTTIRAAALALAAALVLTPSLSSASAATDESGSDPEVTWSIAPAGVAGPDGRVSVRQTIDPGTSVIDRVAVTNDSETPATFLVYASDGIITDTGDFDLLPADGEPVDGGSWIGIRPPSGGSPAAQQEIEVPAETTVVLEIDIDVPATATPGDHPAGVVAELVGGSGSGVDFAARVGLRVHLRVAGEIAPALQVESMTAVFEPSFNPFAPGRIRIESTVVNSGNVRLGLEPVATAVGPFGLAPASAALESVREVLPGQTAAVVAEMPVWPLFWIDGSLNIVPVVVGDDSVPGDLLALSAPFGTWAVPWAQLVLLVLVVAAIVVLVIVLRRRSRRRREEFDQAVEDRARVLVGSASTDA